MHPTSWPSKITDAERDHAVDELIELVSAVDGVLQAQAQADGAYFIERSKFTANQERAIHDTILKAYRWQYIVSGVHEGSFVKLLESMLTPDQLGRITDALGPLM